MGLKANTVNHCTMVFEDDMVHQEEYINTIDLFRFAVLQSIPAVPG